MIDLTPLEVRKKKGDFRRAMRGYDQPMVDDFLDLVADRLDELVRENAALAERANRQEQQIAEFRERERALTETLVTAQEMREEMRRQTTREAELARRTAEQESAELRAKTAEEVARLRSTAETDVAELRAEAVQEVAQLRASAAQEVAQQRARAQTEAAQLLSSAHQEATELRTTVRQDREREEEALRRALAGQQQFLVTWRTFLEEELGRLRAAAETFGSADTADFAAAAAESMSAGFAAAALMTTAQLPEPQLPEPQLPEPQLPDIDATATAVAEPQPAGTGSSFAGEAEEVPDLASSAFGEPFADASPSDVYAGQAPSAGAAEGAEDAGATFSDDAGATLSAEQVTPESHLPAGPAGLDAAVLDEEALGLDPEAPAAPPRQWQTPMFPDDPISDDELAFVDALEPFSTAAADPIFEPDLEPFAPEPFEPFEPEPFEPEPFEPEPLEAGLDGVPEEEAAGPVGLGSLPGQGQAWTAAPAWSIDGVDLIAEANSAELPDLPPPPVAGGSDFGLDDAMESEGDLPELELPADDGGEDELDAAEILRNAAAAGYRLPELDDGDELLLDDAVGDTDEDDGWLPTLLEDEK